MNTIAKFLAPAAVALLAFNAQAAETISTGGETYRGLAVAADKVDMSKEVASNERVRTGGATYFGLKNQPQIFVSPSMQQLNDRELDRLYLG
ncbi:MAG: hypothetical protein KJZ83_11790 [Burkholderiaceae bacterium]|nr:hypothetical protein [Burkholderiaceae bacterium]